MNESKTTEIAKKLIQKMSDEKWHYGYEAHGKIKSIELLTTALEEIYQKGRQDEAADRI